MTRTTNLLTAFACVLALLGFAIACQIDETGRPLMLGYHGLLYVVLFCTHSFIALMIAVCVLICRKEA